MHLLGRHTTLSAPSLAAATHRVASRRVVSASCPGYFAHAHRAVYPLKDVLTGSILLRHNCTILSVAQYYQSAKELYRIIKDLK